MKVFAFKPTNTFIGKFDIDHFDAIAAGIEQFTQTNQLGPYDYLECSGRTWKLVPGSSGLELREGRVQHQQSSGTSSSSAGHATAPTAIVSRYRDGYRVGAAAIGFGTVINAIGWILGLLSIAGGLIAASQMSGNAAFLCFIYGVIVGVFQIVVFMFFGVLVSAIGQILRSTLDTAVHTSPFLDEQQKSQAMSV
jgi:hypothetical protein